MLSLEEFIKYFDLPPIVPIKRACQVHACGHSHLYDLRSKGKLRIVPRTSGTGVPVVDLYRLYVASHEATAE
jgi:hypothetical protein